ncbi:uncharacterized protein LOC143576792 isoform X2 [Bidens hawaiensis]|uniref:uncharacterized protein LOC143576792 isoform X2 n=1 Tax=Bidens hawaiensis TaxID=980011 RepID=UPI00404B5CD8
MGFDERRIRLEKSGNGDFSFLFVDTHATKECKEKLLAKDINVDDVMELEFCTERSKKSYLNYKNLLEKLYESNPDQHRGDNLAVWESVQPDSRVGRMFGIGSSDPHFLVAGTPSIACGSKSYLATRQSQEVQNVKIELENVQRSRQELENRLQQLELERVEREEKEKRERIERDEKEERERAERDKREQQMHKKLEDIMRKLSSPDT